MTTTLGRHPAHTVGERSRGLLRRWWVWLGAALVLLAVLVWVVAFSPVLGVSAVVVRGTGTGTGTGSGSGSGSVSVGQVRSAAAIGHGTPLLRLDTSAVARRVEALPDVASATVSVTYPSTVTITVRERVAVGYVTAVPSSTSSTTSGSTPPVGPVTLVDATGRAYRTVATPPAGLPRFVLPVGPTATATGQAVASVAAVLPATVRSMLSQIQAIDARTITLVLTDGRVVLWGGADQNAAKALILPALLSRPGTQFDLSLPSAPVVR